MAERRNGPSGVKNAKAAPPKAASGDGRRKAASGNGAKAKTKAKAPRKSRARGTRARKGGEGADQRRPSERRPVGTLEHPQVEHAPVAESSLSEREAQLLGDLFAIVEEHAGETALEVDRDAVSQAFVFSCEHHADQRRKSGEDFINHPVGVAKVCAGLRLDTETLCAALLHDTVEDTSASLEEVQERFGDEIANLVDGVTKLTGITFQSRDE
ncbi:MAG TPA: HD domain-containing protein, partial [Solirubrobacteraceae bacterium]|nr:HD domain-containing protein [Solirubrobacteraceae bacterium]